ncbi:MAG: LLM class F420-dependent oxidoreductase [Chloroflexi bacterium]|nr:MAG: LLM class F420-dependent oxidoreductase [Chloroflexota bacterium]
MKVGIMIEGQEGLTWERWFRIADRVEALGLDSLWRSDHFVSLMGHPERPALEAWVSLTALAARTKQMRFGPLVSPITFRHPALLARMAAGVDLLSNGRLVLGLGAGWNQHEHDAYGIGLPPMKERFDRLEEAIAVIRALWQGGPVDAPGPYYPLRGATLNPRPLQQPGPPLLIGGDGEKRLLRIVAEHADEWNSHAAGPDLDRTKRAKLEEHCRAVGRNPEEIRRSWMGGLVIAEDARGLDERARWFKAFYTAVTDVDERSVLTELRARSWVVGTPEQVGEQLQAWQAAGVDRVMFQYYDLDDLDGLELVARVARAVA